MDGSQTIAWVERRVGALTEAKIEARQATMRLTVEEARERLGRSAEQQLRALDLHNARKWAALGVTVPETNPEYLRELYI